MSSALGKSVCSQVCAWNFYPSNTARQDVVREFSRGNAFNKNLMGSGSSAEPPYEFQVFVWSLACTGAQPQAANGLVGEVGAGTLEQGPAAPGPCSPGEGRHASPGRGADSLQDRLWGAQGIVTRRGTLDPRWESDTYEDLKSVTEQKEFTVAGGEV